MATHCWKTAYSIPGSFAVQGTGDSLKQQQKQDSGILPKNCPPECHNGMWKNAICHLCQNWQLPDPCASPFPSFLPMPTQAVGRVTGARCPSCVCTRPRVFMAWSLEQCGSCPVFLHECANNWRVVAQQYSLCYYVRASSHQGIILAKGVCCVSVLGILSPDRFWRQMLEVEPVENYKDWFICHFCFYTMVINLSMLVREILLYFQERPTLYGLRLRSIINITIKGKKHKWSLIIMNKHSQSDLTWRLFF